MKLAVWLTFYLILLLIITNIKSYRRNKYYKKELNSSQRLVDEAEDYIQEQYKELNQWAKAYEDLSNEFEAYIEREMTRRHRIYNSFNEIDDWIIKSQAEEFIEKMALKFRIEEKSKETVFCLGLHKQRVLLMDDLIELYSALQLKVSTEGFEDIFSLIDRKKIEIRNLI